MTRFKLITLLAVFTALTISCSKDDNNEPDGNTNTAGPKFTAVKSIVNTNCAVSGCHASPANAGGVNLQGDANIVAHGSQIKEMAVDLGIMPPAPRPQLSDSDKAKITDWINAGGKISD